MNISNKIKKCNIDNCESPYYGKGYCNKHYQRIKKHGTAVKAIIQKKICNVSECNSVRHSSEYCGRHYARYKRTGNLFITKGKRKCIVAGCKNPHNGLGYCKFHYVKARTYGHPLCGHEPFVDRKEKLLRAAARRKARKHFENIKLFCVINGCRNKKVGLHHEDYSEPLSVIPLCQKHHILRHAEIRREKFYNNLALAEA